MADEEAKPPTEADTAPDADAPVPRRRHRSRSARRGAASSMPTASRPRTRPPEGRALTHSTHGLAVAAHHADGTQIMQDVFGRNGLFSDSAFGKGQIFGDGWVQMMANHQHVHMFV